MLQRTKAVKREQMQTLPLKPSGLCFHSENTQKDLFFVETPSLIIIAEVVKMHLVLFNIGGFTPRFHCIVGKSLQLTKTIVHFSLPVFKPALKTHFWDVGFYCFYLVYLSAYSVADIVLYCF